MENQRDHLSLSLFPLFRPERAETARELDDAGGVHGVFQISHFPAIRAIGKHPAGVVFNGHPSLSDVLHRFYSTICRFFCGEWRVLIMLMADMVDFPIPNCLPREKCENSMPRL